MLHCDWHMVTQDAENVALIWDVTVVAQHVGFLLCAGVHQADRTLVSGEHWLLSLHVGSVLPGQWGRSEGESQQTPDSNLLLQDHMNYGVTRFPPFSPGSAVFPGGRDRGGEGGVPDETDRQ